MLTFESFLLAQPCCPEEMPTDRFYYDLTCRLIREAEERHVAPEVHSGVIERAAMYMVGYLQDVIADAGLWHGFSDECRRLYGTPVPFHNVSAEYINYELNPEDVGFLTWYFIAMYSDDRRIYPFRNDIVALADLWYDIMNDVYEEAPVPEGYHLAHELDVYEEEDREMLMRLGSWLFLHSWLLVPAFALTSSQIIGRMQAEGKKMEEIAEELQGAVKSEPTGPLAFFIGEWVNLTVHHRLPRRKERQEEKQTHPAFIRMTADTGDLPVKFISGYTALNSYLIDVLGWAPGEEHLVQLKGCSNFVLMANPDKGLLVAPDICQYIAAPGNEMYDKGEASLHAIDLLTERGKCPHDLLALICEKGWLPDARFPGSSDTELPAKYHDFIARCYLQLYYSGD
ncbi:MAG: DUF3843 family protein [Muribaculaceae bacterium]|nr:DUF3843 family protein [Muribaculaceae bacterium]